MRIEGWERRLNAAVAKHMALPAQYGVSDCLIIALDGIEAVTGTDPYPRDRFNRKYKTEAGAARCLRKAGFATVEDALRAACGKEIPPSLAQRGDVGVVVRDGMVAAGFFTQLGFFTRGAEEALHVPVSEVKTAFEVR